jgi:toxin ParE1/3/4
MMKLIILPYAEQDIRESTRYYKSIEEGLDKQFLKVINQAFQIILNNPHSFPIVNHDIRKFVIKDFPFNIFAFLIQK